jgi:hypothetical protein
MPITQGIGLISTIQYTGTILRTNFRNGVVQGGGQLAWCNDANIREQRGYAPNDLDDAVRQLNGINGIGLIVTVGGLMSARAAQRHAAKPFISLIGCVTNAFPGTITGNFHGGVNLQLDDDGTRVNHLTTHNGIAPQQICLLVNPGGDMHVPQMRSWNEANPKRGPIFQANTDAQIQARFSSFQNDSNLRAMIVSGDPFFQDHKGAVVQAANASGKRVCYPLHIYAESNPPPAPSRHTLCGPMLATEYFNLGRKAATVINQSAPSTLDPPSQQSCLDK